MNTVTGIIAILIFFSSSVSSVPVETSLPAIQSYLTNFGYLEKTNPQTSALISEEAFRDAVRTFQRFAGINITGEINSQTIEFMNLPRCGVPDIVGKGTSVRKKRYALQGSKWRNRDLKYKITKYTKKLKQTTVDKEFKRAFEVWSEVSGLTFTEVVASGIPNIEILFASREHADGEPFDGPGRTLAHAFFPQFGGDAHFDEDELWTSNSSHGSNLFQVAAHELGHSLGLSHSDVRGALMAPFYRGFERNFNLNDDDISAIQSLYGSPKNRKKTTSAPKSTVAPRPNKGATVTPETDICDSGTFDAITTTQDQQTYAFKGDYYWLLNDESFESGYPRQISDDWQGLPGNLDAALTWSDGKTFFFKGDKYWRFNNQRASSNYPKLIRSGFAGIPDNIDAAFVWSGNGKTYFIKDNEYWKYDSKQNPPVSFDYPKELVLWDGLPSKIDAAFQWKNRKTYFFSGPNYYRFNDIIFSVDSNFPRLSAIWWFGCESPSDTGFKNLIKSKMGEDEDEDYNHGFEYINTYSGNLVGNNRGMQTGVSLTLSVITFIIYRLLI